MTTQRHHHRQSIGKTHTQLLKLEHTDPEPGHCRQICIWRTGRDPVSCNYT